MAYDNSHVWVVYNVLTAAQMTQISDNISWIQSEIIGGASNPAAPSTNDKFFRTDLGLAIHYDGTRWLTANEYAVTVPVSNFAATGLGASLSLVRTLHAPYFTRTAISSIIAPNNNVSNYWTITLRSRNPSQGAETDLLSYNTSADTASVYTSHEAVPTTQTPANYGWLVIYAAKTSSPGAASVWATVYYRYIIT